MTWVDRSTVVADGLKIFARDFAPAGEARGVPVVCLHGLTRNSADFDDIGPAMARQGRRVIALDMRGRGRSDRDPDPTRYRVDVYASDVVAVLDALGVPRAVFVGTSMGGLITMLIAATHPERVEAAILNDIGPVIDPAGLRRIAGYVGRTDAFASWVAFTEEVRRIQSAAFPDADDGFWRVFARRTGRETADGQVIFDYDPAIAQVFAAPASTPPPDLTSLFVGLATRPVLAVRGGLSDILSPDGVKAMRALAPDIEVAEVPGVGHAPTLDEPISRAAIAAFLDRTR
jgi:pimeloyl-ACP methyl ester carboxylesterase